MSVVSRWRRFIDWLDQVLGLVLVRFLGSLALLGGGWAVISSLLTMRRAFAWWLLFPLAVGLVFLALGGWLWRSRKRLSESDLTF